MNKKLKVYGLFGFPLGHTFSPVMHNRAFRLLGLNAVYLAFELAPRHLRDVFRKKRRLLLDGFNITIPYKEVVFRYCDRVVGGARCVGAVNTVKVINDRLIGYNTDIDGFLASLKKARYSLRGKRLMLFGAGGAGRAVAHAALHSKAACVRVVEVNIKRAKVLRRDLSKTKIEVLPYKRNLIRSLLKETDCLINASGIGLKPKDPVLLSSRDLKDCKNLFVYDLVYNPPLTPLLRAARTRNLNTLNGLDMLLFQGAKAFEIWTGKKPPISEMKKALVSALKG